MKNLKMKSLNEYIGILRQELMFRAGKLGRSFSLIFRSQCDGVIIPHNKNFLRNVPSEFLILFFATIQWANQWANLPRTKWLSCSLGFASFHLLELLISQFMQYENYDMTVYIWLLMSKNYFLLQSMKIYQSTVTAQRHFVSLTQIEFHVK